MIAVILLDGKDLSFKIERPFLLRTYMRCFNIELEEYL